MLEEKEFVRTPRCNFYSSFLLEKDKKLPQIALDRITSSAASSRRIFNSTAFNKPFIILDNGPKLGLKLPDRNNTNLHSIAEIIGDDLPIRLIEVGKQTEVTNCTLGEYAEYLKNYSENHKVLNMISLEFSSTPLNAKIHSPTFVRNMDWIDVLWPINRRSRADYPQVQKYCLAGMAGSYTDFHIDFGGTSVWYHILHGRKRFYFIPPTIENLNLFTKWLLTSENNPALFFFGDQVIEGNCMTFDLIPGETLVIPSGWIHAVYTPEDSLVFGGNFIHSFSILRQLQVNCIEELTKVKKAYRFPYFKQINWYFLCSLLPIVYEKFMNISIESKEKELCNAGNDYYNLSILNINKNKTTGIIESDISESDNEDDEDDDEDDIEKQIIYPLVFNQLPYLVRTCELWLQSKSLDNNEEELFQKAVNEAGYSTPYEIINEWWDVLKHIAALISVEIFYSDPDMRIPKKREEKKGKQQKEKKAFEPTIQSNNEFSVLSSWHYQHVLRIQQMAKLDLLSDAVVGGIDPEFERYVYRLLNHKKNDNKDDILNTVSTVSSIIQSPTITETETYDQHGFLEISTSRNIVVDRMSENAAAAAVADTTKRKVSANKAAARKIMRV